MFYLNNLGKNSYFKKDNSQKFHKMFLIINKIELIKIIESKNDDNSKITT